MEQASSGAIVTVEQIERALLSATVKPDLFRPDRRKDFYHLGYLGPFSASLPVSPGMTLYSSSPRQREFGSQKANPQAVFMVAALPSDRAPPGDVREATQHLFRKMAPEPGQAVKSEKDITIAGMSGYAISGEGQGQAARPNQLHGYYYALLKREKGGYFLLMGSVPVADMPRYLPEFEKIAASFQPRATQ